MGTHEYMSALCTCDRIMYVLGYGSQSMTLLHVQHDMSILQRIYKIPGGHNSTTHNCSTCSTHGHCTMYHTHMLQLQARRQGDFCVAWKPPTLSIA